MKKRFEYNAETEEFNIDPAHLEAGLIAARAKHHTALRIAALDHRATLLGFRPALLAGQSWIERLSFHEDLAPAKDELPALQTLTQLQALTLVEWAPIDFAGFKKLKELVLIKGTALAGLEKLRALRSLYLVHWKPAALPSTIAGVAATDVRISAANKLADISPLFQMKGLKRLMLQDIPKLAIGRNALQLDGLLALHVERTGWTDFGALHSKSLRELELFTKFKSIHFIDQLPQLQTLYIWESQDGDMTPALSHPALKTVYFDKNRRHYSHKMEALQALLADKAKPKKKRPA